MKAMVRATKVVERIVAMVPGLVRLQQCYYRRQVHGEVERARVTSRDRVLCIGGGPLPCTAMEIARTTGALVTAIDCDPQAVQTARDVVRNLGMASRVHIEYGNGCHFHVGTYSVVHIARQAEPQSTIFENVWRGARPGARILVRQPAPCLKTCYSTLSCRQKCHMVPCGELAGALLFVKKLKETEREKSIAALPGRHPHRAAHLAG
ncbi:SAM-dependent methyltransferase [Desulfurispira natronophila]|uniref:2-polyprenyl-3-methyl-5-hydroxy-6-metoxy-1, 4-benzoquinol methylase n=1 Tax=Desulfurispira natronophila TaxID=682562 RepID=A0A7W7Y5K3_9BACT|nr:class I SAM-dependent methyltransferase [Desulfurispira natronophila]MBB5022510.1 2-polyprenyl-3-methyl-5-hydroxy-6-metoxy-1,4-benzoquinol methylase [Desulfurispira natronophila]